MTEDKSFTLRMPEAMLDKLQELATASDMSVAQIVRKALREFLEKNNEVSK